MANTVGVIDFFDGHMQPQLFDVFGCGVNNTFAYSSAPKCADYREEAPVDLNEADGFNADETPPDGLDATPANRLSAGRQQWRGHEGSQTDLAGWDQFDGASPVKDHKWAAHSRPSTGLVYMQARYYDPEVGRFTQADPEPYGPEMMWGQNNRWTYCANDPVNLTDSDGCQPQPYRGVQLGSPFSVAFIAGALVGAGVAKQMLGGQSSLTTFFRFLLSLGLVSQITQNATAVGCRLIFGTGYNHLWKSNGPLFPGGQHDSTILAIAFLNGYTQGMLLYTMFELFDSTP